MNDIIRELRLAEDYPHDITIFDRAANEVKRLRGENERLASSGGKYMAIAEKRYAMYEAAVKRAEKAEIELAESRRIQNASYMDGVKKAIYEIMKEADIPGSQEIRESGDTDDGMCAQAAERIKTIVDDSQRRAQAAEDAIKKSCENCSFNTEPCDSTDCVFYKFKELRDETDTVLCRDCVYHYEIPCPDGIETPDDHSCRWGKRRLPNGWREGGKPVDLQAEEIKKQNEKAWKKYTDDALRKSWAEAIPLDRLMEIVDADLQGRLIVLPNNGFIAKAGETLYLLDEGGIIEVMHCGAEIGPDGKISATVIADDNIFQYREPDAERDLDPNDWCTNEKTITPEDIGKTVFYTREHAERAQKGDV